MYYFYIFDFWTRHNNTYNTAWFECTLLVCGLKASPEERSLVPSYPPTAYSTLLIPATPARDRRVDIGAILTQRSVTGLYTSHSEWIANKLPPGNQNNSYLNLENFFSTTELKKKRGNRTIDYTGTALSYSLTKKLSEFLLNFDWLVPN